MQSPRLQDQRFADLLAEISGHRFSDDSLLLRALTHRSYIREEKLPYTECNERLEFLGDSLLNMTAAEYLFHRHPDWEEGRLTRLRALIVCEDALLIEAERLMLGQALSLGRGEEHNGGRSRTSILADAVEAVIAALYLDGGMEPAQRFILSFIPDLCVRAEQDALIYVDYKTRLQEFVQKTPGHVLSYEILSERGPDHEKEFEAGVFLDGALRARATGKSKKAAEQACAAALLAEISRGTES